MTNPPIVSLDTETLGLAVHHPIWELALIRREPDGAQVEHHWYVRHDDLAGDPDLPESFRTDYESRYDESAAILPHDLATILRHLLRPIDGQRPIFIGSNPSFDAERIGYQIADDLPGLWHHRAVDVATLAAGYLYGRAAARRTRMDPAGAARTLPWKSDHLAERLGIHVSPSRHTALGDARWALDLWDAVTGPHADEVSAEEAPNA